MLAMGRQKAWGEGVRAALLEEGPQAEAPGGDGVSVRSRPLLGSRRQHEAQTGAAVRGGGTVAVWCPEVCPPLLLSMRATAPPLPSSRRAGALLVLLVTSPRRVELPLSVTVFSLGVPKL